MPSSSTPISRFIATTSKNFPVPAAHLSFIAKLITFPSLSKEIAFESCPPMLIIVFISHSPLAAALAPIAFAVISLIFSFASLKSFLPYPVATI